MKKIILSAALLLATAAAQASAPVSLADGLSAGSYSESGSWNGGTAQSLFNGGSWNAGAHGTQWAQVDLGNSFGIGEVSFTTNQVPDGFTWYSVYVSNSAIGYGYGSLSAAASVSGPTVSGTPISFSFSTPVTGRYVEIVANGGPSWTAISNGKVLSAVPEASTYGMLLLGLGLIGVVARRKA